MGAHLRPVGPLPEAVYWRRRAALLLALLLLLVLLKACTGGDEPQDEQLVTAPVAGQTTPAAADTASAAPSRSADLGPSPSPSADPTPDPSVPVCQDADLTVQVRTATLQYRVGEQLPIRVTVRNAAVQACTAALGQGGLEVRVLSGSDRIWSSDDCDADRGAGQTTLQPGRAEVVQVSWSGRRSRPGCRGPGEQALPGTYRAVGHLGELTDSSELFSVFAAR